MMLSLYNIQRLMIKQYLTCIDYYNYTEKKLQQIFDIFKFGETMLKIYFYFIPKQFTKTIIKY